MRGLVCLGFVILLVGGSVVGQQSHLDPLSPSSLLVQIKHKNIVIGAATGFVVQKGDKYYLVTNRHVVLECAEDADPTDVGGWVCADRLSILHNKITATGMDWFFVTEELFGTDGKTARWFEHPTLHGFRIVSLNTVFWSNKYRSTDFNKGCATVESAAASALLAWLESQLAEAEQAHEKVWLMFHIPPGIDGWASTHPSGGGSEANGAPAKSCVDSIVPMWVPERTASFEKLLDRYHGMVLASFAGYTHVDSFMLIGAESDARQSVLINPAISPVYDQNPGFRIVDFRGDGTLADQTTYYLTNLSKAGGSTRGRWKKEYTFSRQWKTRQLDGTSLTKIYNEIASESDARARWLKFYMVSSTDAPIPAADLKGLYCAMGALDLKSYAACACGAPSQP
jgi:hypothetical protein